MACKDGFVPEGAPPGLARHAVGPVERNRHPFECGVQFAVSDTGDAEKPPHRLEREAEDAQGLGFLGETLGQP